MPNSIGILNEKPLHAALKQWYAGPDDLTEVPVDGFMVDIVRGNLLVEIQTANLSSIRRKLMQLVERHPVRLVYPVSLEKWIVRQSGRSSRAGARRKSPKRGTMNSIFIEVASIASLLAHPNFSLHIVFILEEEVRRFVRSRSWRRKGWRTHERRLLQVVDERVFETPQDMQTFLPDTLTGPFTTEDLAKANGCPVWLAQKMAYSLRVMGAIAATGKRGRHILYVRATGC